MPTIMDIILIQCKSFLFNTSWIWHHNSFHNTHYYGQQYDMTALTLSQINNVALRFLWNYATYVYSLFSTYDGVVFRETYHKSKMH